MDLKAFEESRRVFLEERFPSPCGVMDLKVSPTTDGECVAVDVSVPFRGNGFERPLFLSLATKRL